QRPGPGSPRTRRRGASRRRPVVSKLVSSAAYHQPPPPPPQPPPSHPGFQSQVSLHHGKSKLWFQPLPKPLPPLSSTVLLLLPKLFTSVVELSGWKLTPPPANPVVPNGSNGANCAAAGCA